MYIIKQLKNNFINLVFLGFEKMGKSWLILEENYKEKILPEDVLKKTLKEISNRENFKPKTNTQIVKEALGPDYIDKDWKDLREILWEKTKEELEQEKEQNGFSGEVMSNLDNNEKKILIEVLGERTIKQATSWEIYTLKQEGFDLSKIFLKDKAWKFSKWKWEIKSWNEFTVEFYWNKDIDKIVWIWDILDINNISEISVNNLNWKRKSTPRPGFYAWSKYLAIHENYNISILKEENFTWDEFDKSGYNRFSQVRGKEIESWLYTNIESDHSSIDLPFKTDSDKELFKKYIEWNYKKDLSYDIKTNILKTTDWKSLKSKNDIIWSNMIPKNAWELMSIPGFSEKLNKVCKNLWINKNHLLIVMWAECWFNHKAVNPSSWASGLIQFMPSTAKWLWTTVSAIRQMWAVEQLTLVESYFNPYKWKLNNIVDLYKAVFFPISLNKPNNWVFRSKRLSASKVANQNWVISKYSTRGDWFIDWYAFKKYVAAHVASKSIVYEDIIKDVSEVKWISFNSITFYHNDIEKSFEQFDLSKDDIIKAWKVIIERWWEKLTDLEIFKIKETAKEKFWEKIKIVINIDKSYWWQLDV